MRSLLLVAALLPMANLAVAAAPQTFPSSAGPLAVEAVADGLAHPWSLAFLPDGRMLVTERPGRMRIVTTRGKKSKPLAGVPAVRAEIQAGLMDVILDRGFADNRTIYFSYVEPYRGGGRIAIARARLDEKTPRLTDLKVIFRQHGPPGDGYNIGCRIVQAANGDLFASQGDHFSNAKMAQTLDNDLGKIVRIRPDGSIPPDNPFVGRKGARPEIWAYGVRNPEGLAFDPATGRLWEQEHGPRGGDEINIIRKGANYGWPVVSFGVNYDGSPVGTGKRHGAGMVDPVWHWTPSIAPSGMTFYTGSLFPQWKDSLFNGALKYMLVSRLTLDNDKVLKEERLLRGIGKRIRDVRQGPDGALYLLTDEPNGQILKVTPAKK